MKQKPLENTLVQKMGMRKQNLNQKGEVIVVCLLRKATLVEQPNKIDLLLSISISQNAEQAYVVVSRFTAR